MSSIPRDLLRAANRDPAIRYRVFLAVCREPILLDGVVVGFISPHQGGHGWRLGPIYVAPEHRSKGLAAAAIRAWMEANPDKPLTHFIATNNTASAQLHRSLGFELWRRARAGGWFRVPNR